MKVVILAGGLGTRISEETDIRPKPMVEIGGKPILWHIMKIYAEQGYNEFVVCLGYKGYVIKEYFANLFLHQSDITIDLENNKIEVHNRESDNWKITLVDTGRDTMTGGRIKRIQKYIGNERFMLTYGDGLSDVDVNALLNFHNSHGKQATVTSIKPDGRFGVLGIDETIRFIGSMKRVPMMSLGSMGAFLFANHLYLISSIMIVQFGKESHWRA